MSTAIAKKPLRQVDSVQHLLQNDQARQQLSAVAAKHMNPERLMRVTANAIRTTPKLQECEPLSFLGGLMQCAALGLEPNTVLGHAYLIPFWNGRKRVNEVQVVVGYKGLIDLARRSGHITSISANIHYSDDELWEYEEGTEARLRHRPGPQDGEKLHAYAIAKFTDGGHAYVVLPWAQVMKTRDNSQGYKTAVRFNKTDSPWMAHEDAMAKKTAIRALAKYLPLSVEFVDAVQIDNDAGARVDYASFAMNPDDGATIDDEFVEEDAEDAAPEQQAEEAKPAAKKPKEKEQSEPEVPEEHRKAFEQIEQDLTDGAPAEATATFHADALEKMKAEAPELHQQALDMIQKAGQED
ncbi:recombinase RecT [Leisingera sp. JC11]|uniref:recombinase RecT n=1 Tax=Leisingera sp. JC11 TaxID=3042469 RepID=UPI00345733F2